MSIFMQNKFNIAICGATGYTGLELIKILSRHPFINIRQLIANSNAGSKINNFVPEINLDLLCLNFEQADFSQIDLVFFATPNGFAQEHAKYFLAQNIHVIDLSADHRFDEKIIYALPEINRQEIIKAGQQSKILLANPGCYTTSGILGLAPLMSRTDCVDLSCINIDGKSGISGAGRKLEPHLLFSELNENLSPYALAKHRHRPEFELVLSKLAKEEVRINFAPHLIPMTRGLLTTAYVKLTKQIQEDEVKNYYRNFYKDEKFINIVDDYPQTKWAIKTNKVFIHICLDSRTNTLIVSSALDNLYKGAASQAVQNMNLLFGLAEDTGL